MTIARQWYGSNELQTTAISEPSQSCSDIGPRICTYVVSWNTQRG
jgi:hypothetical protein